MDDDILIFLEEIKDLLIQAEDEKDFVYVLNVIEIILEKIEEIEKAY